MSSNKIELETHNTWNDDIDCERTRHEDDDSYTNKIHITQNKRRKIHCYYGGKTGALNKLSHRRRRRREKEKISQRIEWDDTLSRPIYLQSNSKGSNDDIVENECDDTKVEQYKSSAENQDYMQEEDPINYNDPSHQERGRNKREKRRRSVYGTSRSSNTNNTDSNISFVSLSSSSSISPLSSTSISSSSSSSIIPSLSLPLPQEQKQTQQEVKVPGDKKHSKPRKEPEKRRKKGLALSSVLSSSRSKKSKSHTSNNSDSKQQPSCSQSLDFENAKAYFDKLDQMPMNISNNKACQKTSSHSSYSNKSRTDRLPNLKSNIILQEYQEYCKSYQNQHNTFRKVTPLTIQEYVKQRGTHFQIRGIDGIFESEETTTTGLQGIR